MTLPVAILVGGLATRLGSLVADTPKALIDVAGRPFIEHQLLWLARCGATYIVLCVGYLGEKIQAALGDGSRFGIHLQYAFDGPKLLGTGGALRRALPLLGPRFLILYGDSYLDCDCAAVEKLFLESGKLGLMTVFQNNQRWDTSNVLFANGQILRYDKHNPTAEMRHIDYGLGALSAAAFDPYPDNAVVDLATVYESLVERKQMAGFEVTTRFYEIGSPGGLEETRRYLQRKGTSDQEMSSPPSP